MKLKQKKSKKLLSDKIADALTVKPSADIEDDHVFGTKPKTVSRVDLGSSDSEDVAAISDFRKRNVNLLSEVSKKYEGQVVSREDLSESDSNEGYEQSDSDDHAKQLSAQNLSLADSDSSEASDLDTKLKQIQKQNESCKMKSASDTEDESSGGESDDYSIIRFNKSKQDGESEQSSNDGDDDDDINDEEGYDISQLEQPVKEEFEHVKKQNISEEAKKGACVRNQLLIWEGLLEMRIHMQRCMNTANQMPFPKPYERLKECNEFTEECNTTKTKIYGLLDKFMMLQNLLLKKFPETKHISKKQKEEVQEQKKQESDEEIPSDTDNEEIPSDTDTEEKEIGEKVSENKSTKESKTARKRKIEEYEKDLETTHKAFKSFRDATIQKWNEKTRLATTTNIKNTPTNTVLQQIAYILSDKEKLIRRTQLKRSEYEIVGYKKPEANKNNQNDLETARTTLKNRKDDDEYIPEIFDDSDFYHQLLRELIECKSGDISDPVQLSRQWIALQQMRSKMKRKVDTKASKGRKVKYVVHNKLVNYMAPVKSVTWTDESINELYSSLFGKMFENNNVGGNVNVENSFKLKN